MNPGYSCGTLLPSDGASFRSRRSLRSLASKSRGSRSNWNTRTSVNATAHRSSGIWILALPIRRVRASPSTATTSWLSLPGDRGGRSWDAGRG